jgi:hypothetical protein
LEIDDVVADRIDKNMPWQDAYETVGIETLRPGEASKEVLAKNR